MLTAILMVFAVLLAVAVVFMVTQCFRGCFVASVWVCCGAMGSVLELLGDVVSEILKNLKS